MNFKKITGKLLVFIFLFTIIPINIHAYTDKVILGGETIGINLNSVGVMIVGFYDVDGVSPGLDAGLLNGDIIIKVNDKEVETIDDLSKSLDNITNLKITYLRNGLENNTTLKAIQNGQSYKTGLYIKDKVVGVGTIAFIDPDTKQFCALGHTIKDSKTGVKFEIKDGQIYDATITDIVRSKANDPGEKNANFNSIIGTINKNTDYGIYGMYQKDLSNDLILIADKDEIKTGKAYIRTMINNDSINNYEIEILKLIDNDSEKNIFFKIIDKNLLKETGGIIQGMSGSPIIQNNKIVGAVNYVVVDEPSKGYGVFISNMLKEID